MIVLRVVHICNSCSGPLSAPFQTIQVEKSVYLVVAAERLNVKAPLEAELIEY